MSRLSSNQSSARSPCALKKPCQLRHLALIPLDHGRGNSPSETDENGKAGWNLFHKAKRQLMMSCQSILTTVLFGRKRYLPPDGQPANGAWQIGFYSYRKLT